MSKIAAAFPRVFLGAVFFLFGLAGLFHLLPAQPPMEGAAGLYMTGMTGSYLFTLVKLTEVVAGALLLSNRFVPLALAIAAPVLINIFAFHAFYAPAGLVLPVLLLAAEVFVVWKHRAAFAPMLAARVETAQADRATGPGRIAAAA